MRRWRKEEREEREKRNRGEKEDYVGMKERRDE